MKIVRLCCAETPLPPITYTHPRFKSRSTIKVGKQTFLFFCIQLQLFAHMQKNNFLTGIDNWICKVAFIVYRIWLAGLLFFILFILFISIINCICNCSCTRFSLTVFASLFASFAACWNSVPYARLSHTLSIDWRRFLWRHCKYHMWGKRGVVGQSMGTVPVLL